MVECLECNNQCWVSFQLVDEAGDGKAYAGLAYELTDTEGTVYQGTLDANGKSIKHDDLPCGGIILSFSEKYKGGEKFYEDLTERKNYKIPLTQLQYAAEQTQWLQEWRGSTYTYLNGNIKHRQLEVRDFVEHVMHLPVYKIYGVTSRTGRDFNHTGTDSGRTGRDLDGSRNSDRSRPPPRIIDPKDEWTIKNQILGSIPPEKRAQVPNYGVGLKHNEHHILEIKALRALRPKLSLDQDFSALNLYQLSFLTAMAYTDLTCYTARTDNFLFNTRYRANGSTSYGKGIGNTLVNEWATHQESGIYGNANQNQKYAMLLEDVPYSKRLEIVPFDPDLYPQNSWNKRISTIQSPLVWNAEGRQETPDSVHFFDDSMLGYFGSDGTDTQGFLTHNDEVLIVSIRGTQEMGRDILTDLNAIQVPIQDYAYRANAHKGFHSAYSAIRPFIKSYLDRFHTGQKIIVIGHSLGGAIATLTAEWIRQQTRYTFGDNKKVILYTYGSPRVGDLNFLSNAQITHYRMVAENDPVPSVPGTWLTVSEKDVQTLITAGFGSFIAIKVFSNDGSTLYSHQGELFHFTNLSLHNPQVLADELMWQPGCMGVQQCSIALELEAQLPNRVSLGKQLLSHHDHYMFDSYIPFAHATFTRWKGSLENNTPIVSAQEITQLKTALINYRRKLDELAHEKSIWDFVPIIGTFRVSNKLDLMRQARVEMERVDQDLQRANTLANRVITKEEFYGKDVANHTSIDNIYNTWLANDKQYRRPEDIPSVQS